MKVEEIKILKKDAQELIDTTDYVIARLNKLCAY